MKFVFIWTVHYGNELTTSFEILGFRHGQCDVFEKIGPDCRCHCKCHTILFEERHGYKYFTHILEKAATTNRRNVNHTPALVALVSPIRTILSWLSWHISVLTRPVQRRSIRDDLAFRKQTVILNEGKGTEMHHDIRQEYFFKNRRRLTKNIKF